MAAKVQKIILRFGCHLDCHLVYYKRTKCEIGRPHVFQNLCLTYAVCVKYKHSKNEIIKNHLYFFYNLAAILGTTLYILNTSIVKYRYVVTRNLCHASKIAKKTPTECHIPIQSNMDFAISLISSWMPF